MQTLQSATAERIVETFCLHQLGNQLLQPIQIILVDICVGRNQSTQREETHESAIDHLICLLLRLSFLIWF